LVCTNPQTLLEEGLIAQHPPGGAARAQAVDEPRGLLPTEHRRGLRARTGQLDVLHTSGRLLLAVPATVQHEQLAQVAELHPPVEPPGVVRVLLVAVEEDAHRHPVVVSSSSLYEVPAHELRVVALRVAVARRGVGRVVVVGVVDRLVVVPGRNDGVPLHRALQVRVRRRTGRRRCADEPA
jgi:hypothetical protein